jgi:Bacterial Ig-like domain
MVLYFASGSMHMVRFRPWAALLLTGSAVGCAGNGEGLDENGQPISGGGPTMGTVTADYKSIQDNVFTPICSKCHIGASAPEGLQLDAAHSYNLLVGVPSNEQPDLLRVKPGHPDDSYMVRKIEGLAGIDGGQMPLGETPLPQATIDAIRQWITNGAPNVSSGMTAAVFAIESTAPVDRAMIAAPLGRILVTFTQDADASLVNDTTVLLQRIGASGPSGAAGAVPAAKVLSAENAAVLLITPSVPLDSGTYRVTLRGTGGGALANLSAATLGADTSFEFTVEPAR